MKHFVVAVLICLAFASLGLADPIACAPSYTLAQLIALNASGGCFSQDKLFTDFSYDRGTTVNGVNTPPTADRVKVDIFFIPQGGANGGDLHTIRFNAEPGASPLTGFWSNDYTSTIDYTITVYNPVYPGTTLDLVTLAFVTSGNANTNNIVTGTFTPPGSTVTLQPNSPTGGGSSDLALHYNSVAVHMTVKAGKVGTINGQITTLTNSWTESIPEPATYALLGSGLIALVAVARKAKRN